VRAFTRDPERSRSLLEETLAFERRSDAVWELRGTERGSLFAYDSAPVGYGMQGSGTVHHVAWCSRSQVHAGWHELLSAASARPSPIIDRYWFRSIYFREPSGVLFAIATAEPGFGLDESPEHLGERLALPPLFESLRDEIELSLTPLPDPRVSWSRH
jgi:glyoxalase family protein